MRKSGPPRLRWSFPSIPIALAYFVSLYYKALEEDNSARQSLEKKAEIIKRINGHWLTWLGKYRTDLLIQCSNDFMEQIEFLTGNKDKISKRDDLAKRKLDMVQRLKEKIKRS